MQLELEAIKILDGIEDQNQLISDGILQIKGKTRPAGSQNEAYFHANWGGGPGKMNNWLVAWPGAFRLETLRRLNDWEELSLNSEEELKSW